MGDPPDPFGLWFAIGITVTIGIWAIWRLYLAGVI